LADYLSCLTFSLFSELAISQRAHSAKVEILKAKGEEAFKSSTIGGVNKQLRKWLGDNHLKTESP